MSAEVTYVDKIRKNETTNLWRMRFGRISYSKLDVMMKKLVLRGLLQLEVRTYSICANCQYGKTYQFPYADSKFQAIEPLKLVHFYVFGPVKQASNSGMKYGDLH